MTMLPYYWIVYIGRSFHSYFRCKVSSPSKHKIENNDSGMIANLRKHHPSKRDRYRSNNVKNEPIGKTFENLRLLLG